MIAILCSFIIGNTQLPFKIFSLFGVVSEHAMSKTEAYLDSAKQELERAQVSTFGIAKRIIIPLFFIYFRNKISLKEKYFNVFLNAYVFGTCFYFLFYKTLLVMVSRGGFYFNVFEALLTSSLFFIVDKKYRPIIVFIFIVMSIFYLNQSISAYPEMTVSTLFRSCAIPATLISAWLREFIGILDSSFTMKTNYKAIRGYQG